MNDCISRAALLKHRTLIPGFVGEYVSVQNIQDAPAVTPDVVRCRDCKHSRERNVDEKRYLVEGVLICTSCNATDDSWNPVFPDHFCSYGERMDGDGNG